MTTIAYKDGVIAYDSRLTNYGTIISDSFNKRITSDGVHFFPSGDYSNIAKMIECYFNRGTPTADTDGIGAFIVDAGQVMRAGINTEGSFWTMDAMDTEAIGTGADHALTAMDMGASAAEAVRMAAKRDSATGGRIRTFKVKS